MDENLEEKLESLGFIDITFKILLDLDIRSVDELKYHLQYNDYFLNKKELFDKNIKNVSDEEQVSLEDLSDISNISNASIVESENLEDFIIYTVLFRDQDNRLRACQLYSDLTPGMVEYFNLHEQIKNDLIFEINYRFKIERENIE